MTATIIDGKAFAAKLRGEIAASVKTMPRPPGLAVVLVGDDPASAVYVRSKGKQTLEVGMLSFEHRLPADTAQADLIALVDRLNADPAVDGILVQLPLPKHLDDLAVISRIDPDKDVDGLHVVNAGRLASGIDGLVSCTPLGCMMLIKDQLGDVAGKNAVVIGRSILVGIDPADDRKLIEMLGQWQLDKDAINRRVNIQTFDECDQIGLCGVGSQAMFKTEHSDFDGLLALAADIDGTCRIIADEHNSQPRRARHGFYGCRNLAAQFCGKGFAVDDRGGHFSKPSLSAAEERGLAKSR